MTNRLTTVARNLSLALLGALSMAYAVGEELPYVPAPAGNPLKGLVPYAGVPQSDFPHSLEFQYLPLSDLMVGPEQFHWEPLEFLLDDIAARGHQAVFRVWIEYPGQEEGIPAFLEADGLKVTEWLNTNTDPFPRQMVRTPDYSDPRLRKALQAFIAALGAKYDGDPRIGFITAGLLGTWGEWHTYPRSELMASKLVQSEVMDAYEQAFQKTPVLLRYPAGENAWAHAANHTRRLGYHDDSFAWATLDTGRPEDHWYFLAALREAGDEAWNKWQTSPIGGEIRPELWGILFDDGALPPQAQDFSECVRQTHATWLMDSGLFREQPSPERRARALRAVQRMGYEFHIQRVSVQPGAAGGWDISLHVRNTGVAPFYHDWNVELARVVDGTITEVHPVDWSILGLLPGEPAREWTTHVSLAGEGGDAPRFAIRIANPLPNGVEVRFANEYAAHSPRGWWLFPE